MNYEFKGTKGKWYPVSLDEFWTIRDGDFYDSTDIFNEEECSEAKENIVLASNALIMFDILKKVLDLAPLLRYSGILQSEHVGEAMAVENLLDSVEQVLKKATKYEKH